MCVIYRDLINADKKDWYNFSNFFLLQKPTSKPATSTAAATPQQAKKTTATPSKKAAPVSSPFGGDDDDEDDDLFGSSSKVKPSKAGRAGSETAQRIEGVTETESVDDIMEAQVLGNTVTFFIQFFL